jgi:hypothetical protein
VGIDLKLRSFCYAHMSDRKKQEITGLKSIYAVNMAGYKSALRHD